MAVSQGYGKIITSGSVFAYDITDPYNCFKGKPTTNLVPSITNVQGTNDTTYFKTNYGTEDVYIEGLGGVRSVRYCNVYNDYVGGSGQCCPNLFYFNQISVNASTEYVYQIIYRTETGYANANYMYQYQYGASGYISEFGLLNSTRQEDLGGGWKHAWGTFITDANATYIRPYLFHYEYATYNKVQLAGVMISQGSQVLRPRQFLPVTATRSSSQSLYNLSKNIGIDLTSVSFDASGSLLFDGTDDNITTDVTYPGANATFEVVIKCLGNVSTYNMFMGSLLPYMGVYQGNSIIFSDYISSVQRTVTTSAGTISLNVWNHVVCTRYYDGVNTTNTVYINGVSIGSGTFSGSPTNLGNSINIGDGQTTNWYPFSGYVAVARIYNRTLSNTEIINNYTSYKRRFYLS